MRLRVSALFLSMLLTFGTACNKPSSQPSDNSAQTSDNGSVYSGTPNGSSSATQSSQRPVPVTLTVPAGKVVTVRLADPVGSKISQAGQSFGGTLAKAVEVGGEVVIP